MPYAAAHLDVLHDLIAHLFPEQLRLVVVETESRHELLSLDSTSIVKLRPKRALRFVFLLDSNDQWLRLAYAVATFLRS